MMFCLRINLYNSSTTETRYFIRISEFVRRNPELYLSQEQLCEIFRLYRKWIRFARYRFLDFERDLLHYIAERAFWSDLKDSDLVVQLMISMCLAGTHFLCLRVDQYPKAGSSELLRVRIAEYFLCHANRRRLVIGDKRVMDLLLSRIFLGIRSDLRHPCKIAVAWNCPNLLLVLLQYGALATDSELTMYPLTYLCDILETLKSIIRRVLQMVRHCSWELGSLEDFPEYQRMVACGRLLLRVSPQIDRPRLFVNNVIGSPGFPRSSTEREFRWVVQNALPELEHRLFQPMQLKHACRLSIRKVLYKSWQLPRGIESLPLPRLLRMYLNLHSD